MRGCKENKSHQIHVMRLKIYTGKSPSHERLNSVAWAVVPPFVCVLTWVASIFVGCGSKEIPRKKRGWRGRGKKETLADKPLDFENCPFGLSSLSDFMLSLAVIN